jgi:hypothetical protein
MAYNKYRNKIVKYKGIKFDSIKERNRYIHLKMLSDKGIIKKLELQPSFLLQEKFTTDQELKSIKSNNIREIKYVADFKYFDTRIKLNVVEDVKGMLTPEYKLKRKLFLYKLYKQKSHIIFKEITSPNED